MTAAIIASCQIFNRSPVRCATDYRQAKVIMEQVQTAKQTLYAQNQTGVSGHLLRHVAFDQLWLVVTNSGPAPALNVTCNVKSENGKAEWGFPVGPLGAGEK